VSIAQLAITVAAKAEDLPGACQGQHMMLCSSHGDNLLA